MQPYLWLKPSSRRVHYQVSDSIRQPIGSVMPPKQTYLTNRLAIVRASPAPPVAKALPKAKAKAVAKAKAAAKAKAVAKAAPQRRARISNGTPTVPTFLRLILQYGHWTATSHRGGDTHKCIANYLIHTTEEDRDNWLDEIEFVSPPQFFHAVLDQYELLRSYVEQDIISVMAAGGALPVSPTGVVFGS